MQWSSRFTKEFLFPGATLWHDSLMFQIQVVKFIHSHVSEGRSFVYWLQRCIIALKARFNELCLLTWFFCYVLWFCPNGRNLQNAATTVSYSWWRRWFVMLRFTVTRSELRHKLLKSIFCLESRTQIETSSWDFTSKIVYALITEDSCNQDARMECSVRIGSIYRPGVVWSVKSFVITNITCHSSLKPYDYRFVRLGHQQLLSHLDWIR